MYNSKIHQFFLNYLRIISENAKIYEILVLLTKTRKQPVYDLFSSKIIPISNDGIHYT